MKSILIKICIILVSFSLFSYPIYATEENIVENHKTENLVKEETVQEKPTETKKNETMYVQERCNIRSSYSVDSERVGGLDVGTEVTVVAEYSNGWYKIKHDDGEAYIKSGILRSTKPEIPEEEQITEEEKEEEIPQAKPNMSEQQTFMQENDDEVDNEYAELINEIGVLPEVGKNIADYLYMGMVILTIIFVIYVKYKF